MISTVDRFLLDTHVWLWWQLRPERMRPEVRERMVAEEAEVFLSTVSSWEMTIKIAAGRLQLPKPLDSMLPESLVADRIQTLPVLHHHSFALAELPMLHRDPFDRMLIAQAQAESLTLVTADAAIARYDVAIERG